MEIKEYIKLLNKDKKIIIQVTMITALAAFVFSLAQKPYYETSVSLFISKNSTQNTDEFKYDGYYALESGEIIADNIEKMLQSPQIVNEIYQNANISTNFNKIKHYKKSFTAHKMSNQYVEVSFKAESQSQAKTIAESITQIAQSKTEQINKSSEEEISFLIDDTEPIIVERKADIVLNSIIGLISGMFLGILAILTKKYFA